MLLKASSALSLPSEAAAAARVLAPTASSSSLSSVLKLSLARRRDWPLQQNRVNSPLSSPSLHLSHCLGDFVKDPTKNKRQSDFVKDRRKVKREYDEFKVRINGLPDSIRRRSDAFNAREEMKMLKLMREKGADPSEPIRVQKATWMADGTHWPGTWTAGAPDHAKGDHASILQVMLKPPSCDPLMGMPDDEMMMDFTDVDIRLPMMVYVSGEKWKGYDHNKKAGATNALHPEPRL